MGAKPDKPDLLERKYYVYGNFIAAAFEADVIEYKLDLANWDRKNDKLHNEKGGKKDAPQGLQP